MIVNLSEIGPQQLVCPPNLRRVELVDQGGLGLYVEVRASSPGVGTYYLRYKDANRRTCHQKIGSTAVISAADARREAKRLKAEITLGADPRALAKARKAVLTYTEFFEQHYLPYVKARKRSWDRDDELYRLRIKARFGGKRLNEITRHQIQSFHTALAAEGLAAATANHHLKLIRQSLNLAISWKMLDQENAAARLPMLDESGNKVERYLDDASLERLLAVLRTDPTRNVSMIALFLLATGCRLNEVLSGKWSDIDMGRRVFAVLASNSKSKRVRAVPLNDAALDVLKSLDTRNGFDYLFINRETKKPYTTIAKVWDRLRRKAGLPQLRLHDLRHQFASFLVNDGRTLYEVQQILGHSTPQVTMRYAHLSTKTLQDAANSASVRLNGVKSHG